MLTSFVQFYGEFLFMWVFGVVDFWGLSLGRRSSVYLLASRVKVTCVLFCFLPLSRLGCSDRTAFFRCLGNPLAWGFIKRCFRIHNFK